jgi:uracil-DNA glycosylase
VPFPPSLKNIFKELKDDINPQAMLQSGNLTRWAEQGILLLNASLSVRAGEPMSHSKIGWEIFTDAVIKTLSDQKKGIIFILWGNFARSKKVLIDTSKHFIIESAHPSPLGAHK